MLTYIFVHSKIGINYFDKKARVTILVSDKIDFKTKAIKKDKEGHYIMIEGSIQEDDFTLVNIYAPKYIKQILTDINGEIDRNTIMKILTPH